MKCLSFHVSEIHPLGAGAKKDTSGERPACDRLIRDPNRLNFGDVENTYTLGRVFKQEFCFADTIAAFSKKKRRLRFEPTLFRYRSEG